MTCHPEGAKRLKELLSSLRNQPRSMDNRFFASLRMTPASLRMTAASLRMTAGAIGAAAVLASTAQAQLGSFNAPPGPQGTFAIRGGRVVTVSGAEIPNGTVVISGGKITAVPSSG